MFCETAPQGDARIGIAISPILSPKAVRWLSRTRPTGHRWNSFALASGREATGGDPPADQSLRVCFAARHVFGSIGKAKVNRITLYMACFDNSWCHLIAPMARYCNREVVWKHALFGRRASASWGGAGIRWRIRPRMQAESSTQGALPWLFYISCLARRTRPRRACKGDLSLWASSVVGSEGCRAGGCSTKAPGVSCRPRPSNHCYDHILPFRSCS